MNRVRVLVLIAAAALCACHGDSGAPPAGKPAPRVIAPPIVKKGPSVAEQTAGMVEAATQGKSTVEVELKFDLPEKPQVGKPLDVNVAVLPQIAAGPVAIDVADSDGLQVAAGAGHIAIASVDPGEVYRETVKVTPTADGVLLLGLTVSLKHDEITESRVFSIPLIVDR